GRSASCQQGHPIGVSAPIGCPCLHWGLADPLHWGLADPLHWGLADPLHRGLAEPLHRGLAEPLHWGLAAPGQNRSPPENICSNESAVVVTNCSGLSNSLIWRLANGSECRNVTRLPASAMPPQTVLPMRRSAAARSTEPSSPNGDSS